MDRFGEVDSGPLAQIKTMQILIVLGHPDSGSFNHAIAQAVAGELTMCGHHAVLQDLYTSGFDPIFSPQEIPGRGEIPASIQPYCDELCAADGIIIIHPNWWGQPPAILKGWIDRVIRPGLAYRFEVGEDGKGSPVGLLRAKTAIVFNTANTDEVREREVFGDPLELIWRKCVFDLCGVRTFHRKIFTPVVASSLEQRLEWIEEAKALCRKAFG